jgi:hypothetical protein
MGRLTDILQGSNASTLRDRWNETSSEELEPLPGGNYLAEIAAGELCTNHKGTAEYKLTFRIAEGEHVDRRCWHDLWLTPAALPFTKRSLGKLGITSLEQLECPLPAGIICSVSIALRSDDSGVRRNRIVSFDVVAFDEVEKPGSEAIRAQKDVSPELPAEDYGDADEVPF